MQVVLLRHGATDWNIQGRCQGSTDLELNEIGIRQAQEIAALLNGELIDAVYSSNLKRARQTAQLIGTPRNLPVTVEPDIRELDHGELEGLTFSEIKQNYPDFIHRWRKQPAELQVPGGERLIDVAERAWHGLKRIVHRHDAGETVVVVSHNFPILGILCRIAGIHLNHYRAFHLDPCGVSRLHHSRTDQWQITHINSKEYDPERTILPS